MKRTQWVTVMVMMKPRGATTSVLVSAVFAVSLTVIFLTAFFNDHHVTFTGLTSSITATDILRNFNITTRSSIDDKSSAVRSSESVTRSKPLVNVPVSKMENGLGRTREAIARAALNRNLSLINNDPDILSTSIYHNPAAFYQSYIEMERRFKIYVYEEGEPPLLHHGPAKEMYSVEGRFMREIEFGKNHTFRTYDPGAAHLFFMPFSVVKMVAYLYVPNSLDATPLMKFVSDYIGFISTKYPYWNRSQGADHFMLACHDWGPMVSTGHDVLYNTSIRGLCNANSSEGFDPRKDVSVPEIHLVGGEVHPKLLSPPSNTSKKYLAFFAGGGNHGPVRPILLKHWKGKDPELQVYDYLKTDLDGYLDYMLHSKFCLCPSGYEVASPRISEAIYAECVPVILSVDYVLPLSDVLNWDAFSIRVNVTDIPRLKEILKAVTEDEYLRLKEGLRAVRRHWTMDQPAKRFDAFHMILHSLWLRRINLSIV